MTSISLVKTAGDSRMDVYCKLPFEHMFTLLTKQKLVHKHLLQSYILARSFRY